MSEPSEISVASLEFTKALYFDSTNTIRHYDTCRTAFTQFFGSFISVYVSALAVAATQNLLDRVITLAAGIGALVSLICLVIILKFGALISLQRRRAALAMKKYQDLAADIDFSSINIEALNSHNGRFLSKISLGLLWVSLFAILFLINFGMFAAYLLAKH